MCLCYYFLVHATPYSCLQTDAKHIFNLHHDRQYSDESRLRGSDGFRPVGFDGEVAAVSVGLGGALRLMLLSLMNCFLLASSGSPWPVVLLHLDLGLPFNTVQLWWPLLEDERWLVRRILSFFQLTQKLFTCLYAQAAFQTTREHPLKLQLWNSTSVSSQPCGSPHTSPIRPMRSSVRKQLNAALDFPAVKREEAML